MDVTTTALTISAGIGGVILGTFLRPLVEEWFALRRKTLHVIIQESSEFRAPHESVIFNWHGEELQRLIQTGFRLENRTGRTLRNFRVEIGAPPPVQEGQVHAVYLQPDSKARYTINENNERSIIEFELFEPKACIFGSMLSNYTEQIDFSSLDDVEIRRTKDRPAWHWWIFLAGLVSAMAANALLQVIAVWQGR